jgi:hypothetical protein
MAISTKILAAAMLASIAVSAAPAFAQALDASQKPERLEPELWAGKSLGPASASLTDNPSRFDDNVYKPADRDAGNLVEKTWQTRHPEADAAAAAAAATPAEVRDPNHVVRMPGPQPADRNAAYYDSFSAFFAGTPSRPAQRS